MERINLAASASATSTLENGTVISARKIEEKRPIPGDTAMHEAAHVVAAGKIVYATIVPSGDALGATQPVEMNAATAMAADAMGHSGTGWDRHLTENILRVDLGVGRSAARSALSGREEEINEVATTLQEEKTIGQGHVEKARENVENRRSGIFPIEVEIITPDGERQNITTESFRGEVKISNLMSPDLALAA